jgi:hypothetical protein
MARNDGIIETFTGKHFSLINPQPDQICIEDIAHALARICRFTGHCSRFYSVAAHSVWCADYAKWRERSRGDQFAVLMHDAAEAYVGDINKPLKNLLGDAIKEIEGRVQHAIAEKFGFEKVDYYREDMVALSTEASALMASGGEWWGLPSFPAPDAAVMILPAGFVGCEEEFLRKFEALRPAMVRA